jgi:triacylglycerol esterase/lipase EstA (alpha/beta hydrolase family)
MEEIELTAIGPAQGSTFVQVLVVLALLALAAHFLGVLFTFVLHFYDTTSRGTRPPQPLAIYASAFVGDWWFTLAYLLSFLPGYLPSKRLATHRANGGPPVVLVHGFILNRACMFAIYWRLRRQGYQHVYTVNLDPIFGPLQDIADNLIPRIREIAAHHGVPVHAVAHSMGGVVMRKCLQHDPDLPVATVVTLGTPHHGSGIANFGMSAAAREMRPGSTLLSTLPQEPSVPFTSIYSLVDGMVLPADSAMFGQRMIQFTDVGHISLMYSPRVFDAILSELPALEGVERRDSA